MADISRQFEIGVSKRQIIRNTGVGWRLLNRALEQSEVARLPKTNGHVLLSRDFNTARVEAALAEARRYEFHDSAAGGRIVPFRPNSFQEGVFRRMYGMKREDGTDRRYIDLQAVSVPKRNGKTLLCAVLCLLHMAGPEAVPRSKIIAVAQLMPNVNILIDYIRDIIDCTPHLRDKFKVVGGPRPVITNLENNVELRGVPGTYDALTGFTVTMFVIDEFALFDNSDALYALRQAQDSVLEPLGLVISTKSDVPGNPMARLIERWKRVSVDKVEDANGFDMVLLGMEDGEDWRDPKVWRRVNPGMPHSPREEKFHERVAEAEYNLDLRWKFINQNLNGDVSSSLALFDYDVWLELGDKALDIDALRGQECYGGLDLSQSKDMTAFALFFPDSGALFAWAWLPANRIDRMTATDGIPYRTYVTDGDLFTAGEDSIGPDEIAEGVAKLCEGHSVRSIGYDRYNYGNFEAAVVRSGYRMPPMLEFAQHYGRYGPAVNHFEHLLFSRRLRHPSNPVFDLAMKYTSYERGKLADGARKPAKMPTSVVKIDPVQAAIMAVGMHASLAPAQSTDYALQLERRARRSNIRA